MVCMQSTGVEFPEVTTLWDGDKMRSVGAGVRAKKFGFLPVKVPTCPCHLMPPLLCRHHAASAGEVPVPVSRFAEMAYPVQPGDICVLSMTAVPEGVPCLLGLPG